MHEFNGFKKVFLLKKPPDRREPERPTEPTRAQDAPETQARRTQSDDILNDIQYLKNVYGQALGEDARPIPYAEAAKLFQKVETWACQIRVLDACGCVEKAAKTIEEAADKLQNKQTASYAKAARIGSTRAAQGVALDAPLRVHPKEEKCVKVKIPNKMEAQIIKQQSKEEIVARIRQVAGGKAASHTVGSSEAAT